MDFVWGEIRDNIRMDCMGFVWRIYELLGDTRPVPWFSSDIASLSVMRLPYFGDASVGDVILLRKKITSDHWKYRKRVFSHLGIKYSETEIVHLPREGLSVEPFNAVLGRYIQITHAVVQKVIFDASKNSYVFPAEEN